MRVLFALLALAVTVSAQGLTGPNFFITAGDGSNYTFSINGAPVLDPALSLTVGTTYKFFLNASMSTHPFGFSSSNDESVTVVPMEDLSGAGRGGVTTSGACTPGTNPLSWFTTSGSETTNPCIVSITPPANITGLSIYYRCSIHPKMVGMLTAVAAGGSSTTSPPTGTTTSPPTGTTTQTPTTPAPTGSSTGKNSAAIILPGAAALVIAAINALFSA